jgi:hypothetical protein
VPGPGADIRTGAVRGRVSGSERTVAECLLAGALERQAEQVRRLLLRTSVLERVNGELADLLTGCCGERTLQELEAANVFVVSLDTWPVPGKGRDRPSGCALAAQVAERLLSGVGAAHAVHPGAGRRRR